MEQHQKNKNLEDKMKKKGIGERQKKIAHTHNERVVCLHGVSDCEVPLLLAFSQEMPISHDLKYFVLCGIGKEKKYTQTP